MARPMLGQSIGPALPEGQVLLLLGAVPDVVAAARGLGYGILAGPPPSLQPQEQQAPQKLQEQPEQQSSEEQDANDQQQELERQVGEQGESEERREGEAGRGLDTGSAQGQSGASAAWFDLTNDGTTAEEFAEGVDGGLDGTSCRTKVAELLRFHTSKSGSKQVSLQEYVDRMKEGQHDIYYITGATIAAVSKAPQLKALRRKRWEALYIVDPAELYCVQQLGEFDGKPLKSATKEGLDTGIHNNPTYRRKVAEVLRVHTTKSGDEKVSLKDYVDHMKDVEHDIYYISGDCFEALAASPLVETFRKRGLEVIFVVDAVVEFCFQQLKDFEGKKLVQATKEDAELLRFRASEFGVADCSMPQLEVIAGAIRLHSSESGAEQISLEEYVDFMPEGQNAIYCIMGESIKSLSSSPSVKASRKRGFEVLYLVDPIDEYCVQQLKEFDGLQFKFLEPFGKYCAQQLEGQDGGLT